MPIDLAQVDWLYVAVLAIFVFVTTAVGGVLSFGHRWTAATLSALSIRGAVRVLDLLPAPRAAAADNHIAEFAGQHGRAGTGCARRSSSAAKAA